MLLLIDRLGKSGASVYPVAGHHTPVLRVRARRAGVGREARRQKLNRAPSWMRQRDMPLSMLKPTGAEV